MKKHIYTLLVLVAATSRRDSYDDYVQDRGKLLETLNPRGYPTSRGVINGFHWRFL